MNTAVINVIKELLNDQQLRPFALAFLVNVKERSIIDQLKTKIRNSPFCAAEIEALAELRDDPAEFEDVFYKVLDDEKYKTTTEDARYLAAVALSQALPLKNAKLQYMTAKKNEIERDIDLLNRYLTNNPARLAAKNAKLAELKDINKLLSAVTDSLQRDQYSKSTRLAAFLTNKLADAALPTRETLMLLECFKNLHEPAFIPDLTAKLRQSRNALATCLPQDEKTRYENRLVRYFTTVTIAGMITRNNREGLKIVDEEMVYWKEYITGFERTLTAYNTQSSEFNFYIQVKEFVQLVEKIKAEELAQKAGRSAG